MTCTLSQLHVYPIKSTTGISLNRSHVSPRGLSFDRDFILRDPKGRFITARTHPKLVRVEASLTPGGLLLSAPGMPNLAVSYAAFSDQYLDVKVWGSEISAQHCQTDADHWFTAYLETECQLVYFGEQSQREVDGHEGQPVSFADGYPLLLISQGSLNDLNSKCPAPISFAHMRPNLVISSIAPFAEDSWSQIRIGEVEFDVVEACSRCVFTTVDPKTGVRNEFKEPLKTLKQYRRDEKGEVFFGQNLIPRNQGVIRVGDSVEILGGKSPVSLLPAEI